MNYDVMPLGSLFFLTSNRNESQHVSVLVCLLNIFTLAEHNAEKVINYLAKELSKGFLCLQACSLHSSIYHSLICHSQ